MVRPLERAYGYGGLYADNVPTLTAGSLPILGRRSPPIHKTIGHVAHT